MPGSRATSTNEGVWVNDIHSRLNRTRVRAVVTPETVAELPAIVRRAARDKVPIALSGSRHAMGGQQFATNGLCLDLRRLGRVLSFDRESGLIEAEAGIEWPQLIHAYLELQRDRECVWGIAQKQTGADAITLGGSLSANAHGRGLTMKPLIADIESFRLVNSTGEILRCSREENAALFRAAIGGYGLFGVVAQITLRLVPRQRLRRVVKIISAGELIENFETRIAEGFLYGDWQFSIDERSPDFLQTGVFSCYEPVSADSPVLAPKRLLPEEWLELLALAHTDRARAFDRYAAHYLGTDGQTYWSDTNQLSPYLPGYHAKLREKISGPESSLMITELYVPRLSLAGFLSAAAQFLEDGASPVIYGTVRLIEKDEESFLPWAREAYACVIFNLQVFRSESGLTTARRSFRALIDLAIARGGSFYLTYHRFAERKQVSACYPEFEEFLARKKEHDPSGVFQSDWYRHYESLFADRERETQ